MLFINYMFTEQDVTFRWGELSLAVRKQEKLETNAELTLPVKGLAVEYAKIRLGRIQFSFSTSNQIIADNTQFMLSKVVPLSSQNGFSLLFKTSRQALAQETEETAISNPYTIMMTFQVNEIFKDEIIISINSEGRHMSIPFKAPFDTRTAKSVHTLSEKTIQTLSLSGARGTVYSLRILGQGKFQKSKGYWHIFAKSSYSILRYGRIQSEGFQSIERRPIISNAVRDDSKLALQNYIDKAYHGWIKTRYDDKTGTYLHPEGVYGFSEQALAAAFAESKRRNEFISNRLMFDRTAHLYQNARTWRTAALRFENPREISHYLRETQNRQNYIQQSIQEQNYAILLDITLVETVYAFFEERAQREFLVFVNGIPSWTLSPQIATSLLLQYKDTSWVEFQASIDEKKSVLEQIILENITVANAGYLLRQSPNELTIFYSVLAGRYLAKFGTTDSIKNIGHRMIVTVLNLSDDFGFLPRIYVFKNKTTFSLGFITPEMLYAALVDNKYYPRARHVMYNRQIVSSQEHSNKKLVLLTTSPFQVSFASKRIHLDVEVTNADVTQYVFVLRALHPKGIYAFDTLWSGKYFISKISRAVYHDSKNNIIIIKISSKNKKERISFVY